MALPDPEQGADPDSADEPLPGFEAHGVGPGAPRGTQRPERLDGLTADGQGAVLRDWLDDGSYEEWVESYRRSQLAGHEPYDAHDPYPLRGGELCDRCGQLAMIATEHVWTPDPSAGDREIPAELATLGVAEMWRSGVLLWCSKHARENQHALLTAHAVVVGVRGS